MIGPRYTPREVAAAFAPAILPTKNTPAKKPAPKVAGEPPIVGIFKDLGQTVAPAKDLGDGTGYRTTCPWASSHTDGGNDLSGFLTVWPDGGARHWNDRHKHCAEKTLADIYALARERGLEVPEASKKRRTILITPPESRVADEARKALAAVPGIYVRRGRVVHVHRHAGQAGKRSVPAGSVVIQDAGPAWLRERLSESADFEKLVKVKGETQRASGMVPEWLPPMIQEAPGPGFQGIRAVVTTPVFLADGSIHAAPGELCDGVLYLGPSSLPTVPEHPSEREAESAWNRLQALVEDFPFGKDPSPDAYRAAWLGSLLTPIARYAIDGAAPLVLLEANGPAAGKGLLAQGTTVIATGQSAPVMACPREESELMKAVTPVLMEATRVQLLDEVPVTLGSRGLNSLITATDYQARILGLSRNATLPNLTTWVALGNNLALAPDTARRVLPIRLEPMQEHPEDRDDFKIPDLLGHVRKHQAELLRDALTILKAFHCAGRPASGLRPWGSFEPWSRLVRDCVFWTTKTNLDCRRALAAAADLSRAAHADLVSELYAAFGANPFTVGSVVEKCITRPHLHTALEAACPTRDGRLHAVSLGKRFAGFRRRPVNGMMLDQRIEADRKGSALWCIQAVEAVPLKRVEPDPWEAIV